MTRFDRYLALLLLVSSPAFSLAAQPDAGSLLQQQKQAVPLRTMPELPDSELSEASQEQLPPADDSEAVMVNAFRFGGELGDITEASLQQVLQDARDKAYTLEQMRALAERVTDYYKGEGYLLARAYLPEQELTDGVLSIDIIKGKLDSQGGGIYLSTPTQYIDEEFALAVMKGANAAGDAVSVDALERSLLILNELPGVSAQVDVEPGTDPNSSRLKLKLTEVPSRFSGRLGFDNEGSRYTGASKATLMLSAHGLSGRGDALNVTAHKSSGDYDFLDMTYSKAVGAHGLRLGVGYNQLDYGLGEEFSNLDAIGDAQALTLNGSYPLILNSRESLRINAQQEWRDTFDEIPGSLQTDKSIRISQIGLSGQKSDLLAGGGVTSASLTWSVGDLKTQTATDTATNNYQKLLYSLSRVQRVTEDLSLIGTYSGQRANDNLDSSERYQIGGVGGVRAYPTGEGSGDEGRKLSLDAVYNLARGTAYGDLQATVFYDRGWLTQLDDASGQPAGFDNSVVYQGWGLGLLLAKARTGEIALQWAKKVGSNPLASLDGTDADGKSDNSRIWLRANYYF